MPGQKHLHIIQQAGICHPVCAEIYLFGGLKNDLHRARQRFFPFLQQQCGPQHTGSMEVMTAGMHDPRCFRAVGQRGLFRNRQGVYISPQRDYRGFPGSDHCDQACLNPGIQKPHPVFLKNFSQIIRRFIFLHGELRMPVQPLERLHQTLFIHLYHRPFPVSYSSEMLSLFDIPMIVSLYGFASGVNQQTANHGRSLTVLPKMSSTPTPAALTVYQAEVAV